MPESKKRSFRSLSVSLPMIFLIGTLIILLVIMEVTYYHFRNRMTEEYDRLARGVTNLMASEIDGDKAEEYLEKNTEMEEYRQIVSRFYFLKDNYPDVLYMYVCRFEEDGEHIIIDLDAEGVENGKGYEPGYVYEPDGSFASLIPDIMAGKETPGYAVHTKEDGNLYSFIRPVLRSDGSYACSVGVDFSLDQLGNKAMGFLGHLAIILCGITVLVLVAEIVLVRKRVTSPINKLSRCAEKFAYKTEEDRMNNIDLLKEVDIHTKDEIEDVYRMLMSVTRDSFVAVTGLQAAQTEIHDQEERISKISIDAYKDKLTGVGNAAAYRELADKLDQSIRDGNAEFAAVMIDINNLKYINDTFGHGYGDLYIQGCSKIICRNYDHSPVFRIGGDEFVVLLTGVDYPNRETIHRNIQEEFERCLHDETKEPWERYSASTGMAVWNEDDINTDTVTRRADMEMYRQKIEFHKKEGAYRKS